MKNLVNFDAMFEENPKISIHPDVRFGKPCIHGTRIAIEDVKNWIKSGMSITQILNDFPELKESDIHLALSFPWQTADQS